jgi:hypothetical protein
MQSKEIRWPTSPRSAAAIVQHRFWEAALVAAEAAQDLGIECHERLTGRFRILQEVACP